MFEYCISGHPEWDLLVLFLGTPLAVTEFPHVSSAAAARELRVAICSRPGYGGFTRHRLRTVAGVARDTDKLADHLKAESFLVAGWSGGGLGALACTCLVPDRVRACITLASIAPPVEAADAWTELYPADVQDERSALLLTKAPEELVSEYEEAARPLAEMTVETMLQMPETNEADAAALRAVPAAAESLARSVRLAAAGVWGWIDDYWAWVRPWGFSSPTYLCR
jgi:pimeloyl-ACP methyl ester carboxylesterase